MSEKYGIVGRFFEGLYAWVGEILFRFGLMIEPLMHKLYKNGFLMFFSCLGMLILGVIVVVATKRLRESTLKGVEEEIKGITGYYSILAKLFYYPLIIEAVFFCVVSGQGINTGTFTGVVDANVHYTLFNYIEWSEAPKYFMCFAVLRFLLKTAACIIKRKPLKLFRFYVHTIDAVILGWIIGNLFLFLSELSREGFLLRILFIPVAFGFFVIYPLTMGLFLAPLVLLAWPLFVLAGGLIWGKILFSSNRIESEEDAIGFLAYSNAVLDMFSE